MKQELIRLISENQVIMLDTSIAMDDQFRNLVDEIEMPLMENKKRLLLKVQCGQSCLDILDPVTQ